MFNFIYFYSISADISIKIKEEVTSRSLEVIRGHLGSNIEKKKFSKFFLKIIKKMREKSKKTLKLQKSHLMGHSGSNIDNDPAIFHLKKCPKCSLFIRKNFEFFF